VREGRRRASSQLRVVAALPFEVQLMRRGGAPETEEEGCKLRFEVSCEQRKESSSLST
jgi:hypothetical protein